MPNKIAKTLGQQKLPIKLAKTVSQRIGQKNNQTNWPTKIAKTKWPKQLAKQKQKHGQKK